MGRKEIEDAEDQRHVEQGVPGCCDGIGNEVEAWQAQDLMGSCGAVGDARDRVELLKMSLHDVNACLHGARFCFVRSMSHFGALSTQQQRIA